MPLASGVGDEIKEGDRLFASINKDNRYYADWYLFFDENSIVAGENKEIKLMLKGCQGMGYPFNPKAVKGIDVGYYEGDTFKKLGTTNDYGRVTISLENAGNYVVTVDSSTLISDTVTDWSVDPPATLAADCPVMAPACLVTVRPPAEPITVYVSVNNKGTSQLQPTAPLWLKKK